MVMGYPYTRHPLHQLRGEVDRLLGGFFRPAADGLVSSVFRGQPAINVWEEGDALLVEMEVPGVKSEQVDISVVGDELSIKLDRQDETREGATYHRRERPNGACARVLRLPVAVDADRVEAELHDGVLTIRLPKAENAKPRKINVAGA
jgi:HSP20 family protein